MWLNFGRGHSSCVIREQGSGTRTSLAANRAGSDNELLPKAIVKRGQTAGETKWKATSVQSSTEPRNRFESPTGRRIRFDHVFAERMRLKHETSGLNSDTCTVSLARPVISRFLFRHDSKEHGGKRGDGRISRRAKDNVLRGFVPFFSSFACDGEGSTGSCSWNPRRGYRQILADQYGGRVLQPASAQPRFQAGTQRTLLVTGLLVGGRGNK